MIWYQCEFKSASGPQKTKPLTADGVRRLKETCDRHEMKCKCRRVKVRKGGWTLPR